MLFLAKTGPVVMKHEDINNTHNHKLYECMQEVFKYVHSPWKAIACITKTGTVLARHTQLTFRATNGTNEILI